MRKVTILAVLGFLLLVLVAVPAPVKAQEGICTATASGVNIRETTSTAGRIVRTTGAGETFAVSEQTTKGGRVWLKISEGWIASWVVSHNCSTAVAGNSASAGQGCAGQLDIPSIGISHCLVWVPNVRETGGLTNHTSGIDAELDGMSGLTLIVNHNVYKNGAPAGFYALSNIHIGDRVTLIKNGETQVYEIINTRYLQWGEEGDHGVFEGVGYNWTLMLATCFDDNIGRFAAYGRRIA